VKAQAREYDGSRPLVPPEVIERIVLGPPPRRPMLLRWLKKIGKKRK
jgi:hypothetical protein